MFLDAKTNCGMYLTIYFLSFCQALDHKFFSIPLIIIKHVLLLVVWKHFYETSACGFCVKSSSLHCIAYFDIQQV